MARTLRGPVTLALMAASLLAATIAPTAQAQVFAPLPAVDGTAPLPAVTISDVTVLGPSTARVTATVDNRNLDSAIHLSSGGGSVLNQRTSDVQVNAGLKPNEVIVDLLDLEPGSSYNVQAVLGTPTGTVMSTSVPFATPAAVFVNPATGAVAASGAKRTRCTIVGTAKRDRLVGTRKRDVICGLGGNDRILGRSGNDLILAGKGGDRASGGNGRDRIYGNSGRDRLYGNTGRDRLYGGSGNDRMNTAANRRRGDYVSGGSGRDWAQVNRGDRVRSVERRSRR
jgi:Ca2+-binding RTX toxin-like protein